DQPPDGGGFEIRTARAARKGTQLSGSGAARTCEPRSYVTDHETRGVGAGHSGGAAVSAENHHRARSHFRKSPARDRQDHRLEAANKIVPLAYGSKSLNHGPVSRVASPLGNEPQRCIRKSVDKTAGESAQGCQRFTVCVVQQR